MLHSVIFFVIHQTWEEKKYVCYLLYRSNLSVKHHFSLLDNSEFESRVFVMPFDLHPDLGHFHIRLYFNDPRQLMYFIGCAGSILREF